jgi:hypothetical protein
MAAGSDEVWRQSCRWQANLPMPDDPPVTTTVFPFKRSPMAEELTFDEGGLKAGQAGLDRTGQG